MTVEKNTKSFLRGVVESFELESPSKLNWNTPVKVDMSKLENNSPTEEYSSKEDDE